MVFLITGIVGITIGIVVLILSVKLRKSYANKIGRCTATVDGTIIRFVKKEYPRGGDDGFPTYYEVYYFPIYEYIVNGQRYEVQGSSGRGNADQNLIGQRKQICYNPDNCNESYVSDENIKLAFYIAIILGAILFMAGAGSLFLFFLMNCILKI